MTKAFEMSMVVVQEFPRSRVVVQEIPRVLVQEILRVLVAWRSRFRWSSAWPSSGNFSAGRSNSATTAERFAAPC